MRCCFADICVFVELCVRDVVRFTCGRVFQDKYILSIVEHVMGNWDIVAHQRAQVSCSLEDVLLTSWEPREESEDRAASGGMMKDGYR